MPRKVIGYDGFVDLFRNPRKSNLAKASHGRKKIERLRRRFMKLQMISECLISIP